jgi:hypothetical protein
MKSAPWIVALLTAAAVPALAAPAAKLPAGISVDPNTSIMTTTPAPGTHSASVAALPPAKLKVIFDNLAEFYPNGRYTPYSAYTVFGTAAGFDTREWLGMSFSPATNATVVRLELPIKWISGDNRAVISLRNTKHGLPGDVLQSWVVTNMIGPNTCCTVTHVVSAGIPVQAGKRYWVVLTNDTGHDNTYLGWQANVTEPLLLTAIGHEEGEGWTIQTQAPAPALAVYGSP